MDIIVTKRKSSELTIRACQIVLHDEELVMTMSARNLAVTERLASNADTEEKKVN
jgi:hypothetical protein